MTDQHISFIFTKGQFQRADRLEISLNDRARSYGDGVFTTIKVENGIPLHLEEHLQRLKEHATTLGILLNPLHASLFLPYVPSGDWRMKIVVTGGCSRSLALPPRHDGDLLLMFSPLPPPATELKVCRYPYPVDTPLSRIKSLAYLQRLSILQYAIEQGCDEAWVCDGKGHLLEGGKTNVYWTFGQNFYTPSSDLPLLFGITLQQEIQRYLSLGYNIHYVTLPPEQIPPEAKLFGTNSLIGSVPLVHV